MSGEGLVSSDRQRDPGTCLCGCVLLDRYHPCAICADERTYRPGDQVSWGRTASSTMEHYCHDPDVND